MAAQGYPPQPAPAEMPGCVPVELLGPWDCDMLELSFTLVTQFTLSHSSPLSHTSPLSQLPGPTSRPRATGICFVFHFHVLLVFPSF